MPFEVKINKILNDKTILLSDFNTNLPENFSGTLNIIIDSDWKSLTNDKVEMIKNVPGLKEVVIFSNDFEAIKEIDKLLIGIDQYKKGELLNDYKFIDRSYIDISKTNYNDVIIPFDYIMYGIKKNNINLSTASYYNGRPHSTPLVIDYDLDELRDIVSKTVDEIFGNLDMQALDDIDKSVLISNYIQKHMQYIDTNESTIQDNIYYCDSYPNYDTADVYNVINNHYGVCDGFAQLTCLLLNHPLVGCKSNLITVRGHVYCNQQIDGKYYVLDNTWCITRNPSKFNECLKATEFCDDYLLIGKDKISENESTLNSHTPYDDYFANIEEESIPRSRIQQSIEKLQAMGVDFSYDIEPAFKQYTNVNNKTI